MNLSDLFKMQLVLDEAIRRKMGYSLEDDLTEDYKDALDVEIAELQNEVRYFKIWSEDRKMRRQPALYEYVDGLSFFLNLGNAYAIPFEISPTPHKHNDLRRQFRAIKRHIYVMNGPMHWYLAFNLYLGLADLLGFSWGEIEEAYKTKNLINHQRLADGY